MVELTTKQKNKMDRAIKSLNDLRAEVEKENPDYNVYWYFEGDGQACLMGEPDTGGPIEHSQEYILHTHFMISLDCGGW